MSRRSNREICAECGGFCCSFGGATATREEYQEILKSGYEDHFVKMSDNCYITEWGENGICPYQEGSSCTIYDVRPLTCRKFPIVSFNKYDHFIAHCALTEQLSEEEIAELIEMSLQIPDELMDGAVRYLTPHSLVLSDRMNHFRLERIDRGKTE